MLLNESTVVATLPVVDITRARKFYEDKLGLKLIAEGPNKELIFEAGWGSMITLYQRAPIRAEHTMATFQVHNLENVVKELRSKGVKFEDYDLPGIKTENGISNIKGGIYDKGAWFKDSEGNILGIAQMSETFVKSARAKKEAAGAVK
jgi:catechol 2,3-dioxygenase-like lactoylglutathione lyase family enzyme